MNQSTVDQPKVIAKDHKSSLKKIKEKVLSSHKKAIVAVNRELINLYWEIGSRICREQKNGDWNAKTIEKLAQDLQSAFPNMKGFSRTNLKYIVQFAKEYPDFLTGQQIVARIPWGHHIILLRKLKTLEERLWYAEKIIENGWSRDELIHWIDDGLYERQR